jgi:hypothetical protein
MELIKSHRLAIARRDAFFRLSLTGAAQALAEVGLLGESEKETFVETGFDGSIDYASDPHGLFERIPRTRIWDKLEATPQEQERGAEIHKEILERYGIVGPTKVVVASQEPPPGQIAIDTGEFSREYQAALEREGLDCREDALSNLLCEERGR